jgi:hypothetical protein
MRYSFPRYKEWGESSFRAIVLNGIEKSLNLKRRLYFFNYFVLYNNHKKASATYSLIDFLIQLLQSSPSLLLTI